MPSAPKKAPLKNFARVWEAFGFEFTVKGAQAVSDQCPWCGQNKFYVAVETGLYDCKHCDEQGNVSTFLTWQHAQIVAATETDDYRALKARRGIAIQTLQRHGVGWDRSHARWQIPFRSREGNVVNVQLYEPHSGRKLNLPELPVTLYGLDRLSDDKKRILFLCEGPFDAIALDYHLGLKRGKYDILATPGPFQERWIEYFRGRKVRALFDNDKGGEAHRQKVRTALGESRVAEELRLLTWPEKLPNGTPTPEGFDVNDFVRQFPGISFVGFSLDHSAHVAANPKLILINDSDRKQPKVIEWLWPDHIRFGTYVSLSGVQGTLKSTVARDFAARYSTGTPMPLCDAASMPAGHVLYLTAEDEPDVVQDSFELAGGDLKRLTVIPATMRDGEPLNMLANLHEIESVVRSYNARLVIVDGQNSLVGAPDIATDMKGRSNVSNRLHQFAQRLNIALVGIRNEDNTGRALGSQSMGDIARCVIRTREIETGLPGERYFELIFKKVSDAAPSTHRPIPYGVEDLGGNKRRVLWGKSFEGELTALVEKRKRRERGSGSAPTIKLHRE